MFRRLCIPLTIAIDFLKPEISILFHHRRVDWAAMPKAAIKEDRDFETRYRDITVASLQPRQWIMNTIA